MNRDFLRASLTARETFRDDTPAELPLAGGRT